MFCRSNYAHTYFDRGTKLKKTIWAPISRGRILIRPKLRRSTRRTVKWNNTDLENIPHLKYLGITLDITLSYKEHIHNSKMKMATQTNLLKKLSNTKWGCNASTIRATAMALYYSATEYTCRSITCCLRPTKVKELYLLAGITPPDSRRDVVLEWKIRNWRQTLMEIGVALWW